MRIVALVSWFDEAPSWLAAAVGGLSRVGVDHVVALDGCYELYPRSSQQPRSYTDQAATIMEVAESLGVGCTIVRPSRAWAGNEVEKRSALFAYGRLAGADWFYVVDADERVLAVPADLHDQLAATDLNVAELTLVTTVDPGEAPLPAQIGMPHNRGQLRCLFRNLPGLSVELAHYIVGYDLPDGDRGYLRGRPDMHDLEPSLELDGFVVEHRTNMRERSRREAAAEFYRLRDASGAERLRDVVMATPDGGLARVA